MDPADEVVDIVDEDDRVVATATRREVRRRALLHRRAQQRDPWRDPCVQDLMPEIVWGRAMGNDKHRYRGPGGQAWGAVYEG